jgi:undecaprenyl-phosphate galactose phosphotransferase
MTRARVKEHSLDPAPYLLGEDRIVKKRKAKNGSIFKLISYNRSTSFKLALFFNDTILTIFGFCLGLWITGWHVVVFDDFYKTMAFLILGLPLISFLHPYHLYDFHLLFLIKNHIKNLFKFIFSGAFTIGIVLFVLGHAGFIRENYIALLIIIFLLAIGFVFISRFFRIPQLNILMPLGMALLILGFAGLIFREEIPYFMVNARLIFISLLLAAGLLSINRIFLVQLVFNKWLRRRFRRQVVIVGHNGEADGISSHIIDSNAPFWITGTVGTTKQSSLVCGVEKKCLGGLLSLPNIVREHKIDELIVTDDTLDKKTLIALLDYCTSYGISVWFPPKLMPIIDIKLYTDNFCGLPMIRLGAQKNSWVFNKLKHGFDALVSIPLLFMLSPIYFLIAVAIKIDSRGPIFYLADAIGRNARNFKLYKFRSMKINQDNGIHKKFVTQLIEGKIGKKDDQGKPLKITEDPRITRVGKIIRKFSLDELPQIFNVLKGEMSLVGPRPCLPYEFEIYPDWYKKRVHVRPGITGLWQVTGRSEVAFEDMILLDLYYLYNRTFLLDLQILFETIFVVLGKEGAY